MSDDHSYYQNLQTFLNGSSQTKANNGCLLKYLPAEILEMIWREYAFNLTNETLVKLEFLPILAKKFENKLVQKSELLVYYAVEENSNVEIIDWLIKKDFSLWVPRDAKVYEHVLFMPHENHFLCILIGIAIRNKNIDVIKYFLCQFPKLREEVFIARYLLDAAVWSQRVEIVDVIYGYVDLDTYFFSTWFLRSKIPNVIEIATILNNQMLLNFLCQRFPNLSFGNNFCWLERNRFVSIYNFCVCRG